MFNQKAIEVAFTNAVHFDNNNCIIKAVEGSPLNLLAKQKIVNIPFGIKDDQELLGHCIGQGCYGLVSPDIDKVDAQSIYEHVADSVRNHLKFARTVVSPEVVEFVESIKPFIDEISKDPILDMEIVASNAASILFEPEMISLLERHKDAAYEEPTLVFSHNTRTDEEVLELMKTGSVTLDNAVAEYVSKLQPGILQHIWETVFTNIAQPDGDQFKSFQKLMNEKDYAISRSLVTFLVSRKLLKDTPEDANMPLSKYERTLDQYKEQSAISLLKQKYLKELAIKGGNLVSSIVKDHRVGTKIYVDSDVYRAWLSDGGDNDVLLGMACSGTNTFGVDKIKEKSDFFKKVWNNHVALSQTVIKNKKFVKVKEILKMEITRLVNNDEALTNTEKQFQCDKAVEVINNLIMKDLDDIYSLCLKVICQSRYYKTDSQWILEKVDEIKKANPSLDMMQVATLVSIEYVSKWVASMLRVEKA